MFKFVMSESRLIGGSGSGVGDGGMSDDDEFDAPAPPPRIMRRTRLPLR